MISAPGILERILSAAMLVGGLDEVVLERHTMVVKRRVDRALGAMRLFIVDVWHQLWIADLDLLSGQVNGLVLLEVGQQAVPAPLLAAGKLGPCLVVLLGAADVPGTFFSAAGWYMQDWVAYIR